MTTTNIYVFALSHETNVPIGGIKMLYHLVDVLNRNGFSASMLYQTKGFRCTWFENDTKISYLDETQIRESDFLVMPEDIGANIAEIARGVNKVIYNQNCYYTFGRYSLDKHILQTPYTDKEVVATMVVSENSKDYLEYVFPGLKIFRIHYGIEPTIFSYQPKKKKQICFMPRKMPGDITQVINILKFRNALKDWEIVPIENKTEKEVAAILKESAIYLSFGYPEGFSLPPAEAMACGCITIGYHGGGGKEYFLPDFSFPIEVGDIIGFARTVEEVIAAWDKNQKVFEEKAKRASTFIQNNYSLEKEERDIVECWNSILVNNINRVEQLKFVRTKSKSKLLGADAYFERGNNLYEKGKLGEAINSYRQALAIKPNYVEALVNMGAALKQQGKLEEAMRKPPQGFASYQQAIQLQPDMAPIYNNLGNALTEQGKLDLAVACYQKVVQLQPDNASGYCNLGITLAQQEKLDEAIACFIKAIEIKADYASAYNNLGKALAQQEKWEKAKPCGGFRIACFQKAIALRARCANELKPDFAQGYNNVGNVLKQQEKLDEAISYYLRALEIQPNNVEAYYNLGSALKQQEKWERAIACFQRAVEIKPDYVEAYNDLGGLLHRQGLTEEALACYEKALEIKPNDGMRIKVATVIPPIYKSLDDMKAWRQRLIENVSSLSQQQLKIEEPIKEATLQNFYLTYQGYNDKDIQRQIAQLFRPLLPKSVTAKSWPKIEGKLKIGFISLFFHNHSVSQCLASLIQQIPKDSFHISLFVVPTSKEDDVTNKLKAKADVYEKLSYKVEEAIQTIADRGLDILVYTDIGMDQFTYFLAFTRLAKAQCVLIGHPITTGIPTMDYYISSDLMEIPEAQEHYTETLVRVKGMPVDYAKPVLPEKPKDRKALGLPEQGTLYVCPMTLFKVHPEFDWALGEILRRDTSRQILLFKDYNRSLDEQLMSRLQKTIPDVIERVQFLPWAAFPDFMNILMLAEVVLDTFHFSGLNTALMTLACGTPMVTLPSPYLRGRFCYGLYQRMGVLDCVASSHSEYVDIAVKIGTDVDYRRLLKQKILANNAVLYDNNGEGVAETIEFFRNIYSSGVRRR